MPPDQLKSNLAAFVSFAQSLEGDEKGESQSFLDQFFRALGHKSAIEAGEKITPPGLPLPAEERASFITDDCIQPPKIP